MRKGFTIGLLAILTLFASCGTRQDEPSPAFVTSYILISTSFDNNKGIQQKFIDKASESLNAIKYDRTVVIDTKTLSVLLDSAISANHERLLSISGADSVDEEIKDYKQKALAYTNFLNGLYNNEFKEYMKLVDTKDADRFEKSSKLLIQPLQELKQLGQIYSDAGTAIQNKYGLQMINEPPK
jgi:hypothetical protein